MTAPRSFSAGHYVLELDGQSAGVVPSFSGGAAHAEVIKEAWGQKHVGAVQYEDFVLSCGTGMSRAFYDWVDDASNVQGGHLAKDGAVLTCDFNNKVLSRQEWSRGLITAISFPALDAASKDAAAMTIKITPEYTRHRSGDGGSVAAQLNRPMWLGSHFRLKIDGLEEACTHVSQVAPIAITSKAVVDTVAGKYRSVVPGQTNLGDLVISLPESRAAPFYAWLDDFVIKGNNSADREKDGTLDFLAPKLTGLFSLRFGHLGIYEMTQASKLPGAEIRRVTVKMYCENIRFSASGGAIGH